MSPIWFFGSPMSAPDTSPERSSQLIAQTLEIKPRLGPEIALTARPSYTRIMFLVKEILPCAGQKNMLLGTMKNPRSRASSRTNRAFFRCRQTAFAALILCAIFAPASFAQEAGAKEAGLRQIRSYIAAGWDTLRHALASLGVQRSASVVSSLARDV